MKIRRERIPACEPCHECGAVVRQPCRNYKLQNKQPCVLTKLCRRSGAQLLECRCGRCKPYMVPIQPRFKREQNGQGLLFSDPLTGHVMGNR